ncbi:MAG: hypothetical protein WC475_00540 [Candidatus Paceibacterota bacterium]
MKFFDNKFSNFGKIAKFLKELKSLFFITDIRTFLHFKNLKN